MKKIKLSDVAQHAGVSVATVTRVIHKNGYVSQDKQHLVEQAMAQLGYTPPQKSAVKKSGLVGVVLSTNKTHPFYPKIAYSLSDYANKNGLFAIPLIADATNETIPGLVRALLEKDVCGIIVAAFVDMVMSGEAREFLLQCGVPVVIIERAGCYGMNRVLVDTVEGIYLVTEHLIQLGHRHLAYLTPPLTGDVENDRLLGYEKALRAAGIPVRKENIVVRGSWDTNEGYWGMEQALRQNPRITGVVTWSDSYAAGALQFLLGSGKRVPEDISVVGYDDIYAPHLTPPLTSVVSPIDEMAQAAVELIAKNLTAEHDAPAKTITLSPRLIIRSSSAPPFAPAQNGGREEDA